MYYIEQLRSKELPELQSIATELGIPNIKALGKDDIIYRILDEQAFKNSQSGTPAVVKEENRMNRRTHRRARINNEAAGKVYTATGDKAVKLDKTPPKNNNKPETEQAKEKEPENKTREQSAEIPEITFDTVSPIIPVSTTETPETEAEKPAPKKRGRKPKAKAEQTAVETSETNAEQTVAETAIAPTESETPAQTAEKPAPKKRGRKPKAKAEQTETEADKAAEETPRTEISKAESTLDSLITSLRNSAEEERFIPIEELP